MPPRVLVIDDQPSIQHLVHVLLSRAGFEVDEVSDGDSGLEMLARGGYSAVILDLMRPGRGGRALLDRLARSRPDLLKRIIVATGADPRLLDLGERTRIHAVLRKPFDIDELIVAVRTCADCDH